MLTYDASLPFPKTAIGEGDVLILGYFGSSMAPQQHMPITLSHLLGRPVADLGPHPQFFNANTGVFIAGPPLLNEFAGFANGQIDLRGIEEVGELTPNAEAARPEDLKVAIWRHGAGKQADPTRLSPQIADAMAKGALLYCEVYEPRMTLALRANSYAEAWDRYMPEPTISYDPLQRQQQFGHVIEDMRSHIDKWAALKRSGPMEIGRRFHRERRFNERL